MRGSKHNKVVNLHRRMGKPIPVPKTEVPSSTSASQKTVLVTAPRSVVYLCACPMLIYLLSTSYHLFLLSSPPPLLPSLGSRISFVGGKQLSSTGGGYTEAEVKVYPPTSTADTKDSGAAANGESKEDGSNGLSKDQEEPELDLEPVGKCWQGD